MLNLLIIDDGKFSHSSFMIQLCMREISISHTYTTNWNDENICFIVIDSNSVLSVSHNVK